jgi:hypothetical protein
MHEWRPAPPAGPDRSRQVTISKVIKVLNFPGAGADESLIAADYGFGRSGQRPYQSNGCGLRLTTTFLVWV